MIWNIVFYWLKKRLARWMKSQHSKISITTIARIKGYCLILHLLLKVDYDEHKNKTTNLTILHSLTKFNKSQQQK
jgi:hypothetical protein